MEKIILSTSDSRSEIRVGENWHNVTNMIPGQGTVIITDDIVKNFYGADFPDVPVFSIPAGESGKSLQTIEHLSLQLLGAGVDRSGFILAVGGGVVCDITGFLASIYMRGMNCGYVSSTLLSQVDASTGGKNGVNLRGVKNILGTIRQPEFVICDPSMLLTLPEDEYFSGLAELIKTAIIGDRGLFELLEQHHEEIIRRNTEILEIFISRAVRYKAAVVAEDEREKGLRRILNFGHTFGHVIEMEQKLKHGFAIAAGMELAAQYSYENGLCNREDMNRISGILKLYKLTDYMPVSIEKMKQLLIHDKKKSGDDINFVFTCGLGNAVVQKIPSSEILDFYKHYIEKFKKQ